MSKKRSVFWRVDFSFLLDFIGLNWGSLKRVRKTLVVQPLVVHYLSGKLLLKGLIGFLLFTSIGFVLISNEFRPSANRFNNYRFIGRYFSKILGSKGIKKT